jgi:hypothetical protein
MGSARIRAHSVSAVFAARSFVFGKAPARAALRIALIP